MPGLQEQLETAVAEGDLPPAYLVHPLVANADSLVLPFAIYMDGVSYSITDSVVAFWAYNLVTTRRHLICLARKKQVCKCGCRGRCTFWPILEWLRWSCQALHEGIYPHCRHDGHAWNASDTARSEVAGKPMPMKACLLLVKGDWAEFCERLGFPSWSSSLRPCFCCAASSEELSSARGVTLDTAPWHINDDDDFEAACNRCDTQVVVDAPLAKKLASLLRYDKRQAG